MATHWPLLQSIKLVILHRWHNWLDKFKYAMEFSFARFSEAELKAITNQLKQNHSLIFVASDFDSYPNLSEFERDQRFKFVML